MLALTNRLENKNFLYHIDTGIDAAFHGYRYTPQGEDEIDLGVIEGSVITPTLPGFSIEFWVQEADDTTVPVVLPENAVNKNVTYVSDDATIATVDSTGMITPLRQGETTIIATAVSGNGRYQAECRVTVQGEAQLYQLTVSGKDGGSANITEGDGSAGYQKGSRIGIKAVAEPGFEFVRWETESAGSFDNSTSAETIFIMPEEAATVYAVFKKSESETPAVPETPSKPDSSDDSGNSDSSHDSTYNPAPENSYDVNWDQDSIGWRYEKQDGTYASNEWMLIKNKNVQQWKGKSYYLHKQSDGTRGHMYTGWQKIDGAWIP